MRNGAIRIDPELVVGLKNNSETAFRQIFDLLGDKVYNYCRKVTGDIQEAEELLQDIFFKVWQFRARIDPRENFEVLLFTIARNHLLNHLRKKAGVPVLPVSLAPEFFFPLEFQEIYLQLDIAFDHVRNVAIAGLPKGPIHLGDLFVMDPFDYRVIRYELKAADIRALVLRELEKDKVPHLFVSGVVCTLERDPSGAIKAVILHDREGHPLDEGKTYSVGMNSFIACHFMAGIDGGQTLDTTPVEVLVKYLASHQNVDYSNEPQKFN